MANLHYRLSKLAQEWVLWSEDIPVERFDNRQAGLHAAEHLVAAARQRGDHAVLAVVTTTGRARPADRRRPAA